MFVQQPNRRSVRNLLISEECCQLFHFDRSGAHYTAPIDIHQHVKTFIRLVLGVSSFDERVLGLDTSVQWTHENGRKVAGTVSVKDARGVAIAFSLCDVRPVFRRYDLYGRGTNGWRAVDPEGREVFIKDSWREGKAEYTILERAKGVEGVAQVVCYEAEEVTTADLRANGAEPVPCERLTDLTSTRIAMDLYGDSIIHFQSQKQLFAAIRDAIVGTYCLHISNGSRSDITSDAAHKTLVNERVILHRDISQNNILLGRRGAKIGQRGVVADFDLAVQGPRPLAQTKRDRKAVCDRLSHGSISTDIGTGHGSLHVRFHARELRALVFCYTQS